MSENTSTPRLKWDDRRTALLDVAEKLFYERGFAAVSLGDIAEAAGVTKPIAYRHFESREGAYVECARRAQEQYVESIRDRYDPEAPVREQLRAGVDLYFELLETHPERWDLIYGSSAVLPATSRTELESLRQETTAASLELIQASRPDAPREAAEVLAHSLSGASERLGMWWRSRPDIPREHLVAMVVELFDGGAARVDQSAVEFASSIADGQIPTTDTEPGEQ